MFADSVGAGSSPLPRSATNGAAGLDLDHAAGLARRPSSAPPSASSGAAATDTQAASNPAIAGRVPSIGSTTRTQLGRPPGDTRPRSSE